MQRTLQVRFVNYDCEWIPASRCIEPAADCLLQPKVEQAEDSIEMYPTPLEFQDRTPTPLTLPSMLPNREESPLESRITRSVDHAINGRHQNGQSVLSMIAKTCFTDV